jgi:hypothetical protein
MRSSRWLFLIVPLLLPAALHAEQTKKTAKTYHVPYRLTDTNHVLVRAKINGKGPFNFIVDTGAPTLFVATAAAAKGGAKPGKDGWGTIDRFEIEGGLVIEKARGRIEDPFQLKGMNAMGLAGVELHGMIGYTLLAKYKIDLDFTRDKMVWTPLDWNPPPPVGLRGKGGAPAELEMIGSMMKVLGFLMGRQVAVAPPLRGFLGVELADDKAGPVVRAVLAGGPAARAGLKAGDVVQRFQGKRVRTSDELHRLAGPLTPGSAVRLEVARDGGSRDITFKAGEGF